MTIRPISRQILRYTPRTGGGDPDPALYCPAHGYYDPLAPYTSDPNNIVIPPLSNEQIILLCSSEFDSAINFTCNVSNSGQYNVKIYGNNETLISNTNTNNGVVYFYSFVENTGVPNPNGYSTFRVVITPTLGTNVLTSFALTAKTGYASYSWPIIEAYFKTPSLTGLSGFMQNQARLKYIKFDCILNSVTTLTNFANGCSNLLECILPSSLNGVTQFQSAFRGTTVLKSVTWPNSLPVCINMDYLYYQSGISTLQISPNLPSLQSIQWAWYQALNLKGEIILPNMPALTTAVNAFSGCPNITALRFTGAHDVLWNFTNFGMGCTSLLEFQLPSSMNGFNCTSNTSANSVVANCPNLKKIIMPLSMNYTAYTGIGTGLFGNLTNNINLEEITRCNTTWGSKPFSFMTDNCKKLKTFYHPEANIYSFVMNGLSTSNKGALESLELNWNNMFNAERTGANIQITNCNFSTAELNRIMTALPNLVSTPYTGTFWASSNPGYAAMTKSIATAKGWNVP